MSPLTQFLVHPSTNSTRPYRSHRQDCCEAVIGSEEARNTTFPQSHYGRFRNTVHLTSNKMSVSLLSRINSAVRSFKQSLIFAFGRGYPPDAFCLAGVEVDRLPQQGPRWSLKELIGDGFLWAQPKSRRSLEKRLKRKYGHPDYVLKIITPRTDLKVCNVCGDDHEAGVLCPTCYRKVINETKDMQDAIQNELQLEPVEKEVVVLYEGERNDKPEEFFEGKRIVEMKRERPSWFSKNLLQKTTQKGATTTEVKPSDLG